MRFTRADIVFMLLLCGLLAKAWTDMEAKKHGASHELHGEP